MTDLFKDKKYDSFDELTQLIEPFIYPINDAISQLPDEFTFTLEDILAVQGNRFGNDISRIEAISYFAKKQKLAININELYAAIQEFYAFDIAENTVIDMSVPSMTGTIKLKKVRALYTEDEIISQMLQQVRSNVTSGLRRASEVPASRFHELAESFGFLEQMKKCTTFKDRKRLIEVKMVESLKSNDLRIRDYALAVRFSIWIQKWLGDGNLAALKNIAMLKVVSHEGKAIYSINEEKL